MKKNIIPYFVMLAAIVGHSSAVCQPVSTQSGSATGQNAAVVGGRALQALVAQSEIKSDINLSNIVVATGGGLLGGLIGAAVDSARAKKAEELIGPVRAGLAGFDAEALAIEAAKMGFANASWNSATDTIPFSKDSSPAGKLATLDATAKAQVAFVEYTYDISPLFDAVRVMVKIDVAPKAVPVSAKGKAEKRLSPKNLAYSRSATTVVTLTSASSEKEVNAGAWAADNSARAQTALKLAFEKLGGLTAKMLALSENDEKTLNDKANKRVVAGGFTGRPQQAPSGESLLWTGVGFVQVLPLR